MPKYEPEDRLALGMLFRDLIVALQVARGDKEKLLDAIDSFQGFSPAQKVEMRAIVNNDALASKLQAFVLNPQSRLELLREATLKRIQVPDPDNDSGSDTDRELVELDDTDKQAFNVVLDSSTTVHIDVPDELMSMGKYLDPGWLRDLGGYIMRKCR